MIPGSANALLLGSAAAGYEISRSLRFNSADSAYCTRTAGTPTSSGTWTFSGWIKRATLGADTGIIGGRASGTATQIYFKADNTIRWYENAADFSTTAVFRDVSSWYHFVFTKNGSTSCTIYVNGVQLQQNTTGIPSTSPLNASGAELYLGVIPTLPSGVAFYAGHYYADLHFIDGQALDPTSFGEFDDNGIWQPIAYTGTYGTNGFHLDFSDNSAATAAALGADSSGNGNNWTPNNLSVTAGAGNDSLVDVPTNGSETDTGVGGLVRGNYCTLNPLDNGGITLLNGNLDATYAGGAVWKTARSTVGVTSGKYYWEFTSTSAVDSNNGPMVGISKLGSTIPSYPGFTADSWGYNGNGGSKFNNASGAAYGAGYTNGDVIGVALDADNGTLTFYKNNVSQGTAFTGLTSGPYAPALGLFGTSSGVMNFGQRSFAYTAPSGFKALCTANLPAPTIEDGSTAMDVALYTGNGSTQTIGGLGFSPDLVWIKKRSAAEGHLLSDTVRGIDNGLYSNQTAAENTFLQYGKVSSTSSSSFTVAATTDTPLITNESSASYAAWTWDAGSSTVTNNDGSISSQVRANPSAGFSVVTYTAGASGASVGHGLGVTPGLIIAKTRTVSSSNWPVYHASLGGSKALELNTTIAAVSLTNYWGTPSSTTFGVYNNGTGNNAGDMVAYCFAPVAGYSAFGSYTGNGSADGPFVYTGFRPKWVMVKASSVGGSAGYDWIIHDTARSTYNLSATQLIANSSVAENQDSSGASTAGVGWDILSNGFKIRTSTGGRNQSGQTYIYAAFAENPFALARAR